jgi:hypothetical protein
LIDIRSIPYSRYHSQFNYDTFKENVIKEGFAFLYLGDKIGGKYSESDMQFIDGGVDYTKVACSEKFIEGINELIKLSQINENIVLMCVEKDPYFCHRFALISQALSKKNIIANHILPGEKISIKNTEFENKMRAEYGAKYSLDELYSHHNWVLFHEKESRKLQPVNKTLFGEDWGGKSVSQNNLPVSAEGSVNFLKNKKSKTGKKEKTTNNDKNQKLSDLF